MSAAFSSLPTPLAGERFALTSNGAAVACYRAAPDEGPATSERPLILIHSINAAASAYEVGPLFEAFRASRPVYALDLPGYGASDRSDRVYSPRVMTDAIAVLVDAIRDRHGDVAVDGIAVSLSCEYLARAASERPASFNTVCLVSPTGVDRARPRDAAPGTTRGKPFLLKALGRAPWSDALFRSLTRPAVIRFFLRKTWGSSKIDDGLADYDVLTARQPGARFAPFYFLSAFLFSADITRVYEALTMPTLVVHGTRGDFVRYPDVARLVRKRGWRCVVMQTGALPYFEDLPGFMVAYRAFVDPAGGDAGRDSRRARPTLDCTTLSDGART